MADTNEPDAQEVQGKEIAEAGLIAYYDYVMRYELTMMIPEIIKLLEDNPEADVPVEELMKRINSHIAEDYKKVSINVFKDLGRRIGEVAKNI